MTNLVFGVALIVTLIGSLFIAFTPESRQDAIVQRFPQVIPWMKVMMVVMVFYLMGLIAVNLGEISRGNASALPWVSYKQDALRHGTFAGVASFVITLIYNLWTFWIPGHLFANNKKREEGIRPVYPYVINVLTGILLSIENSPAYRLLNFLAPSDV